MDNPNSNFLNPPLGTIAGFTHVDYSGGPQTVKDIGWSRAQLRKFLLNEDGQSFASNDWVLMISQKINTHINNKNNPHNVTFDQIAPDLVKSILATLTPGTPPTVAPFFSYDALCNLPLGDIVPANYTNTNLYRVTEAGTIVNPTFEINNVKTDYITGRAGLPLFSNIFNLVTPLWGDRPQTPLATTIEKVAQRVVNYPFDFYTVSETETYNSFGVAIRGSLVNAKVYTASFFILPNLVGGSLIMSQIGGDGNTATVNLETGVCVCSSPLVKGEMFTLPGGLVRISFTYTSNQTTANGGIQVFHLDKGDTNTLRQGIDERYIFTVAYPTMAQTILNHPIPLDRTLDASTSPLDITLLKIQAPSVMSEMMITVSLNMYPALPNAVFTDKTIFKFGALKIERDQMNIYVKIGSITIFTSDILDGLNKLTVSYAPTKIVIKDLKKDRAEYTGTFTPLVDTNPAVGLCSAHLHYLALYAQADHALSVEYLTNG